MKMRILLSLVVSLALATLALSDELKMRPLGPAVDRYLKAENRDTTELIHICTRGAALYTAYAGSVKGAAVTEKEKSLAAELTKKAIPYYQVAVASAIIAQKDTEAVQREIALLLETYARIMAQSRQLNDELISAPVKKDIDALKAIEPLVLRFAAELDKP